MESSASSGRAATDINHQKGFEPMPELSYNAQERIARQLESIEGRFEELSIRITLP